MEETKEIETVYADLFQVLDGTWFMKVEERYGFDAALQIDRDVWDIATREQQQIQRGVQLDLPVAMGEPIPILYVQMDGTGVPVVKKETVGRKGKTAGEPARTREAKLGCCFTQTTWDEEGYPMRDPDSTTYTGAIETAEEFGKRIYLEAWNRGWSRAEMKVVMGDGAEWI